MRRRMGLVVAAILATACDQDASRCDRLIRKVMAEIVTDEPLAIQRSLVDRCERELPPDLVACALRETSCMSDVQARLFPVRQAPPKTDLVIGDPRMIAIVPADAGFVDTISPWRVLVATKHHEVALAACLTAGARVSVTITIGADGRVTEVTASDARPCLDQALRAIPYPAAEGPVRAELDLSR